jgi:hypothetical protein
MSGMRSEIVELENRIEAAAEAAERCRKMVRAGKVAATFGGVVFVLVLSGLLRLGLEVVLIAIGAALGGIVLSGSSKRTRDELLARMAADETQRAALIAGLALRDLETSDATGPLGPA